METTLSRTGWHKENQISLVSRKPVSSNTQFFDITHRAPQGVSTASLIDIPSHTLRKLEDSRTKLGTSVILGKTIARHLRTQN